MPYCGETCPGAPGNSNSQSTSHLWPAACDSRQTIHTWLDHSNGMVPSPRGFQSCMLPVAPAPGGPVCHQVQQQTITVCVTGFRPPGMGGGCTQSVLGKSGPLCLSTSSHLGQSVGEVAGLPKQKKQGFSEAVAARIEAPQRLGSSTRSIYEAKWCLSNQVDFRHHL